MPSDEARKRKACQACIRAKAKCSPLDNRPDLCYRCQRLNKQCFFEEATRKRGPKTRSRVKQLEQRVESLIDLLAANGQSASNQSTNSIPVSSEAPSPAIQSIETTHSRANGITPVETPDDHLLAVKDRIEARSEAYDEAYDPIETGLIGEDQATVLLNRFRDSFIYSFPFVVVPASTDVNTLRHRQPFLFLAIMATTAYNTPSIQSALAKEFKHQIASRIIGQSHKSLEILQGLLVYAGWFHSFYKPKNQQLAIVLQLCVAMIQDLGLSKNPKDKMYKLTPTENQRGILFKAERSAAEKRAFLGTYFLGAAFAQAWRKRSTMTHTKFMVQCYQSLSEQLEQPSDALIAPLVQLSELMCRISDYFSYDDIDNAEVKGETILEMSTNNFRSELERIKDAVPTSIKQNTSLTLKFALLSIWIQECSLHGPLWSTKSNDIISLASPLRIRMLYRALSAVKTYFNTLLAAPQDSLHHLAFPSWSGWFYAIIVACKLVFLQNHERQGQTDLEGVPHELNNLLPTQFRPGAPHEFYSISTQNGTTNFWDPISVAKEAGIQHLFGRLPDQYVGHDLEEM